MRQSRQPNERPKTKDQPCKMFLQKRTNHSPLTLSIPIAAGRDIRGNVRVRRRVVILSTQTASLPDSESSFLFQILKLMEGRWTRAPSAMPAGQGGQAGDESVFIHFRWRWRRTVRPTISISALDRFPIYGKKEEERGEGERGEIKAPFLPSPPTPLPSHLLRFKCLYPGWPLGGSAPLATSDEKEGKSHL